MYKELKNKYLAAINKWRKYRIYKIKTLDRSDVDLTDILITVKGDWMLLTYKIFKDMHGNELINNICAVSEDKNKFIKIEVNSNPRKLNDLVAEVDIIKVLNDRKIVSAPILLEYGLICGRDVKIAKNNQISIQNKNDNFQYYITEYLPVSRKNNIADLVVSILEQKAAGIYQADLKPDNIRTNNEGACVLVDYDQATYLNSDVIEYSALDYLDWTNKYEYQRYNKKYRSWVRHFSGLNYKSNIIKHTKDGSFDLSITTAYINQRTTNNPTGVYHTINNKIIYADGTRDLNQRMKYLEQIEISANEKILDVGCNAGLLVHYLSTRSKYVTGYEIDPWMAGAAKQISNILGCNASFKQVDLDQIKKIDFFDTIFLFSVIHHTVNLVENCKKISEACNRIILECKLKEYGHKPDYSANKENWIRTSKWDYDSEYELFKGLEDIFPGFKVKRNIGYCDKHRMILELVKKSV
jgi:2-polyprenyl-3-methyl-5-hydroxy-6-metoxy-1,4-benzoquinol methylase